MSKTYGDTVALAGISLEVASGEVFGLLGPNGAGKTTALKIVAGLVLPDGGRVLVNGIDALADPDAAKAGIAYVPDEPTLYPRLTGREFLRFVGRLRRMERPTVEKRIAFHESLFDMQAWLDKRAEAYSHGMTQRVVLSAAFLARPPLYVVDEPLVGLDPPAVETFHGMARAAADAGAAMVLSTHTLAVAERHCDRLGILHRGELVSVLGVRELAPGQLHDIFFRITGTGPAHARDYFSAGD
ncbi:ABC transporter ATP-binding protein [Candidatus Fermentibacterales bacterium]|nr:ABC transporter ATP-binding protein [Candidatus Fermentibacterales bacterium]